MCTMKVMQQQAVGLCWAAWATLGRGPHLIVDQEVGMGSADMLPFMPPVVGWKQIFGAVAFATPFMECPYLPSIAIAATLFHSSLFHTTLLTLYHLHQLPGINGLQTP